MQDCIAWDWIQTHVKVPLKDYFRFKSKYFVELQPFGTRHFRRIYLIYTHKDGDHIATLVHEPVHPTMDQDFGLLKVENKMLYQHGLTAYVKQLHRDLGLKFVNYTRIDCAYDFQKFHRGLSPRTFIKRYVSGEVLKRGRGKGKYGVETGVHTDTKTKKKIVSVMMQVLEETGVELDILIKKKIESGIKKKVKKGFSYIPPEKVKILTSQAEELEFESLKFGSEKSELSYILYNKTKEMQDVKIKPWIQDHWRSHGWDGESEVWRIEFSFKSSTKDFIDIEDGTVTNFKDIDLLDNIHNIFKFHFNKYFAFVGGEKKCRKDRMTDIVLLKDIACNTVRMQVSDKKESKRSDKIWLKKLMEVNQEMRGQDFELAVFTNELFTWYMKNRGLEDWAKKAMPVAYDGIDNRRAAMHQAHIFTLMSQPGQQRYTQLQVRQYKHIPMQDDYTDLYALKRRMIQYTADWGTQIYPCNQPLLVRRLRSS